MPKLAGVLRRIGTLQKRASLWRRHSQGRVAAQMGTFNRGPSTPSVRLNGAGQENSPNPVEPEAKLRSKSTRDLSRLEFLTREPVQLQLKLYGQAPDVY